VDIDIHPMRRPRSVGTSSSSLESSRSAATNCAQTRQPGVGARPLAIISSAADENPEENTDPVDQEEDRHVKWDAAADQDERDDQDGGEHEPNHQGGPAN
jgi:hypothetical protein